MISKGCFGIIAILLIASCSSQPGNPTSTPSQPPASTVTTTEADDHALSEWIGVYSSPEEIGGFTGTVLVLEKGLGGKDLQYRKRFHSDVSVDDIKQDERSGSCLVDRDCIYIPEAYGYRRDEGEIRLHASVERYHRVTVNGYRTLMRDDAYSIFKTKNELYDYGILIQVPAKPDWELELDEVEHPSIKVLYTDQTKPWSDPFVHGPNER